MSEEELAYTWGDETSRIEALKLLSTKENYTPVVDVLYERSNIIDHK